MAGKTYTVRNSFNAGEVSELVAFRDDVSKYNSACLTLENAMPMVEGGAKKIPGTYFGGSTALGGAMFTGNIAGTTLNITAINYGVIEVGDEVIGPGVIAGTVITGVISLVSPQGVGQYSINNSMTISPELMMATATGHSRLVPFQFSTEQGAFLELSAGFIRIWEPTAPGEWALGLAETTAPNILDYDPATAYTVNVSKVLVGPYYAIKQYGFSGALYIAQPYGSPQPINFNFTVTTNTVDSMSVAVVGSSPNQWLTILLANATASKNAASLIQASIRAIGSLNVGTDNFVDLSNWTVTPDTTYYAAPWIVAPTASKQYFWSFAGNLTAICGSNNHLDEFPRVVTITQYVHPGPFGPRYTYSATDDWNPFIWGLYVFVPYPIQLTTPYLETDLFELDCSTQSADVLWIFHPNYPPACVERFGANSWQYTTAPPGTAPSTTAYRGTPGVVKTGYSALGQYITGISQSNPCLVSIANTGTVFPSGSRVYINLVAGMVELNQGEFTVGTTGFDANGNFQFSILDANTGATINSTGYQKYDGGGFVTQVVPMFATAGDYPACGTLYQERLVVAGTLNNPTQVNGSVQDDFPDFIADPNADDHAVQFTLVSTKLDQILNAIGTPNALVLGTAGGVWVMSGGGTNQSLTQTNVIASKQTSMGVGQIQPQLVNDSAIFVSRSARIVIFLVYNFVSNSWDTYDLTRLNRNITLGTSAATSGIAQTAFQGEPYPIFWAVRNDGQLLGLVFNKQDQVYAWFRVNFPGAVIESVAAITGENEEDQVAVVVRRTVNGITQRYFEYFMPQELFSDLSNAFFVQCGQQLKLAGPFNITNVTSLNPCVVTAPGHTFTNGMKVQIQGIVAPAIPPHPPSIGNPSLADLINQDNTEFYTVSNASGDTFQIGMDTSGYSGYQSGGTVKQVTDEVTGMSYLLGNEVVAVGDGAIVLQPTLVTSDTVSLDPYYVNQITIGLPYTLTVQPTNPALTTQAVTTRGAQQKMNRVVLSLYQAMGGQFGTDPDHMYDIDYGTGAQAQTPSMFTGQIKRDMDADWNDETTFYVTQDEPLPFTLRGLVMEMNYNPD